MSVLLIGLNHHTAPVEIRERLAFDNEDAETALLLFADQFPRAEAAILSTCNRVEMIVASESDPLKAEDVVGFLAHVRSLPPESFEPYLYKLTEKQAIGHLFRVTSGLDSMVVGEYQIVNQVKHAYAQACEQGTAGRVLNRLFHHAFAVSKRIRTETGIGRGKVSLPSVGVDVARHVFPDLHEKRILVIGAGEMSQLTCRYLCRAGAKHLTIATRTWANAKVLAEACDGQAVPMEGIDAQLAEADLVVTATSCPDPILTVDRVRRARRSPDRPLLVIDLAVPRNVEPAVGKLPGLFLYDVDSLGSILTEEHHQRISQLGACEKIIEKEIETFQQWLGLTLVTPLIEMMYSDARQLKDMELQRFFRRCPELNARQREAIEYLAERLISKFMHPCVTTLREHSLSHPTTTLAEAFHAVTLKHCQEAR